MTVLRRVILLGTVVFLYNDVTIRDSIARTANEYVYTLLRRSLPQGAAVYRTDSENEYSRGNTLFWEQRKLSEIVTVYDGVHQTPNYQTSGVMFLSVENIATLKSNKFISVEDFKRDYKVYPQRNDILMTRIGDVGTTNVVTDNGLKAYYVSLALLKYKATNPFFLSSAIQSDFVQKGLSNRTLKTAIPMKINKDEIGQVDVMLPTSADEQDLIGFFFARLDTLITLHQREPPKEDKKILNDINTDTLFYEYYNQWLVIYKEGSVRLVTMHKYYLTAAWIKRLIPTVRLCDFDRITYQQLINDYAELHERQTTMDFHHQLKGAILDAVDDGLIARDPTRKVIIKGKTPNDKKKKYLSRYELQKLLADLDLKSGLNMDWLILLIAKTGMRFSEAIAVTPADFDFTHQTLSVNKTWDYKGEGGFQPTKNRSSVRKIRLDWQTVGQFYAIVRELNENAPFFVSKEKKIYNSTLNDVLERHCKAAGIPVISVHGLRHTHASLLLFDGVSIASVAQRLGHSSINTTQKTYLHIIRELENKDIDLIMKSISSLLD